MYLILIIQFYRIKFFSLFSFFYLLIHLHICSLSLPFLYFSPYSSLFLCYCSFRGILYANFNGHDYRKLRVIVSHSSRLLSYVISAAPSFLFFSFFLSFFLCYSHLFSFFSHLSEIRSRENGSER